MLLSISKTYEEIKQPSIPWAPRGHKPWKAQPGDSGQGWGRELAHSAEQNTKIQQKEEDVFG